VFIAGSVSGCGLINAGVVASNNAAENLFLILQRLEKDQQEFFCVMVWSI
jgi:hypothetical protein